MAKGDVVLARASGGQPIVRRVWEVESGQILVTLEDYYKRWQNQKVAPWTFGLEKTNVFKHDAKLFEQLEAAFHAKHKDQLDKLWAQAKHYT